MSLIQVKGIQHSLALSFLEKSGACNKRRKRIFDDGRPDFVARGGRHAPDTGNQLSVWSLHCHLTRGQSYLFDDAIARRVLLARKLHAMLGDERRQ